MSSCDCTAAGRQRPHLVIVCILGVAEHVWSSKLQKKATPETQADALSVQVPAIKREKADNATAWATTQAGQVTLVCSARSEACWAHNLEQEDPIDTALVVLAMRSTQMLKENAFSSSRALGRRTHQLLGGAWRHLMASFCGALGSHVMCVCFTQKPQGNVVRPSCSL